MRFPPAPIPEAELRMVVDEVLSDWSVRRSPVPGQPGSTGTYLHRQVIFRRFRDVIPFMTVVADFADKSNHHPQWENIFKTLTIDLTTWDIGHRISNLDMMLAAFVDRTYDEYLSAADAAG